MNLRSICEIALRLVDHIGEDEDSQLAFVEAIEGDFEDFDSLLGFEAYWERDLTWFEESAPVGKSIWLPMGAGKTAVDQDVQCMYDTHCPSTPKYTFDTYVDQYGIERELHTHIEADKYQPITRIL